MQLGMIGLGRMGANLVRRLMRAGHECVVYDVSPEAVAELAAEGAVGASSLEDLAAKLQAPRAAWIMVPAAYAGATAAELAGHLAADDVIIDGGNSYYRDDIQRAEELRALGIHYLDVGTSGGVFGLDRGFCLMIGGEDEAVRRLEPIFQALAPGPGSAERTPGRTGEPEPRGAGVPPLRAGRRGALREDGPQRDRVRAHGRLRGGHRDPEQGQRGRRRAGARRRDHAPARSLGLSLRHRHRRGRGGVAARQRDLVLAARPGRHRPARGPGARGLLGPRLRLGRGRWTVLAAVDEGVPANVLTAALFERFSSQSGADFADRLLSAMRKQFGGHLEKAVEGGGAG